MGKLARAPAEGPLARDAAGCLPSTTSTQLEGLRNFRFPSIKSHGLEWLLLSLIPAGAVSMLYSIKSAQACPGEGGEPSPVF